MYQNPHLRHPTTTFAVCQLSTKNTATNAIKFFTLYFLTKILTKNRTKWIFTNCPGWCIIEFPSKVRGPRPALFISCTICSFSAKYQSNDISAQGKTPVVLSLCRKLSPHSQSNKIKCKQSLKTMEIHVIVWYNIMSYFRTIALSYKMSRSIYRKLEKTY